jgi:hypothetical protein
MHNPEIDPLALLLLHLNFKYLKFEIGKLAKMKLRKIIYQAAREPR